MIPELKYDHVITDTTENTVVERHTLRQTAENIDITIEADNNWVNIFDGYDRGDTPYANMSLSNVLLRIPIKTLDYYRYLNPVQVQFLFLNILYFLRNSD